jgi:hypothetical protein
MHISLFTTVVPAIIANSSKPDIARSYVLCKELNSDPIQRKNHSAASQSVIVYWHPHLSRIWKAA